jgi:hypothetical protein
MSANYSFSFFFLSCVLLFTGCSTHTFSISEPKVITFKTPKIKYSDMGYVRYDDDAVEVEMFTAGVSIEKITLDEKGVCVSIGCMSEAKFTQEYLNPHYPSDTLRRILQNVDIFSGLGKSEACNGVQYQYIRNDDIDIMYRRKNGEILFKDRLNGVMIKIEDVSEGNISR